MIRERTAAAEQKLAEEYARQKSERLTKEAQLKLIRETSDEIKDLEAKIQAAYMNKERAQQIKAHEQAIIDEKVIFFLKKIV